ncbi:MAG: FAD-linked oxidase C-terminal domain-containing protein [Bacillota bacterium]
MQNGYNAVTDGIVRLLKDIVGERDVIFGDDELIMPYSHDETHGAEYARYPEVVVRAGSAAEIGAIMKLANKEMIPVTPRGAGSGLSGGAVPVYGGILLSLERMNRILEIDRENLVAVVEPGVITNDLNNRVQQDGLFFAGYPMSLETCFVGGNVAENAGGGRAVKYGVTGRYVLGLEVVLPTGDTAVFGGKRVKDVTGYNMVQLMVGSEGTLGIFTKIILKLLPLPKAKIDMLVLFPDVSSALKVVPLIMTELRIIPSGVEFMDSLSLKIACDYLGEKKGYSGAGAILLVEMDGNDREQVLEECLQIGELCAERGGALDSFVAEGPAEQDKIWRVRKCAGEAYTALGTILSAEDLVVPPNRIVDMIPAVEALSQKYGVLMPSFGHVGDGNLHVTIIKDPNTQSERGKEQLPALLTELYLLTRELGGTISGEHGIGHKRKQYMPLLLGETELAAMRQIKAALDPKNILNPGKIF